MYQLIDGKNENNVSDSVFQVLVDSCTLYVMKNQECIVNKISLVNYLILFLLSYVIIKKFLIGTFMWRIYAKE